jgi:RHS repeat-associated protein
MLAEYDGSGACVKDYLYLGGKMIGEFQPVGSKYYYYASDQINSTRLVTDASGVVVHSAQYDPYGGLYKTWIDTYHPKPGFSGKERESGSDYDYFGARYYGHKQYRFLSIDPIINKDDSLLNPQLWNLYSYCRNNPITFFDPDGKDSILGIHTNVYPNASFVSGHAWISLNNLDTLTMTTYGFWPDTHQYVQNNGPDSDVRINVEKDHKYPRTINRYFYLDAEREALMTEFVSKNKNWSKKYNCSDWAAELIEFVIGEKMNVKENVGFGTPRKVAKEIINSNKINNRSVPKRESDITLKEGN